MTPLEFRALLDLWMIADADPEEVDVEALQRLFDRWAKAFGFEDLVDAYHRLEPADFDPPDYVVG